MTLNKLCATSTLNSLALTTNLPSWLFRFKRILRSWGYESFREYEPLKECNLFAVLDLPGGAFMGTSVKTVVLFLENGKPTEKIWYFQLNGGRNIWKTNPLNKCDLAECVEMTKTKKLSDDSWCVDVETVNKDTWDLTVNNPNRVDESDTRTPAEIIAEIEELDAQAAQALQTIKELL